MPPFNPRRFGHLTHNRVDIARMDAFEAALVRLCEQFGFGLSGFSVHETRFPQDDLPTVDAEFEQLPRPADWKEPDSG